MPKRESRLSAFFFLLLLSLLIYGLSQTPFGGAGIGLGELMINPIRHTVFSAYALTTGSRDELQQLKDENNRLRIELSRRQQQEKEIQALRDQFNTQTLKPPSLIPVNVVGLKAFVPGLSLPEQVIIDKGKKDGIKLGSVIVYKDRLVGKVTMTTEHSSLVDLSFKKGFSITATTTKTTAIGVSKGQGQGEILLDNVVLSEELTKGDLVVTKGSVEADGTGAPPGLVIGKIISVDKKPSALFQTAKVQPLYDITRSSVLFAMRSSQ